MDKTPKELSSKEKRIAQGLEANIKRYIDRAESAIDEKSRSGVQGNLTQLKVYVLQAERHSYFPKEKIIIYEAKISDLERRARSIR